MKPTEDLLKYQNIESDSFDKYLHNQDFVLTQHPNLSEPIINKACELSTGLTMKKQFRPMIWQKNSLVIQSCFQ